MKKTRCQKMLGLQIPLCSGHMQPDRKCAGNCASFLRAGKEILIFSIVSLSFGCS